MGVFGSVGGSTLGKAIGGKGIFGDILGGLGGIAGALLPFEEGGKVEFDTPALLHKNEYVLPAGVKPTKAQIKAVNKKKSAPKKKAVNKKKSAPKKKVTKKKKPKFV